MRKRWLIGAAVAVGLIAPLAYAQSVIYTDLSGNECWNAGQGPGGPSQFLCSDVLRNSRQAVAGALNASSTYGSGTLASLRYGGNVLFTVQPTVAVTLTLPPNPVPDGAIVGFCNVTGSNFATTAIAWTTSTGQTLNTSVSVTTLGANACKYAQFNRANTTWYVIQ
jgi:hypothetical protein